MSDVARADGAPDDRRARSIVRLVELDALLQAWRRRAKDLPLGGEERAQIVPVPGLASEDPDATAARWVTVFAQEIELVHEIRNLAVHGVWVSDEDISRCLQIGGHVLGLLVGPAAVED